MPAWELGSYSIGKQAGGISQKTFNKISQTKGCANLELPELKKLPSYNMTVYIGVSSYQIGILSETPVLILSR